MDAELKQKWLVALRSGEYEQGRGQLCFGGKFCCLGVLAEVAEGFTKQGGPVTGDSYRYHRGGFPAVGILPDEFLEVAGIRGRHAGLLMDMNDSEGRSFMEIADYIEEEL